MNESKLSKVNKIIIVPKIYLKSKSNENNNYLSNQNLMDKNEIDKNKFFLIEQNKSNYNLIKLKQMSKLLNFASNYWEGIFN